MDRKITAGTCMVRLVNRMEWDADEALWVGIVGSRIQAEQLRIWANSASGGDFELEIVEFDRDVFFVDTIAATEDLKKAMAL